MDKDTYFDGFWAGMGGLTFGRNGSSVPSHRSKWQRARFLAGYFDGLRCFEKHGAL